MFFIDNKCFSWRRKIIEPRLQNEVKRESHPPPPQMVRLVIILLFFGGNVFSQIPEIHKPPKIETPIRFKVGEYMVKGGVGIVIVGAGISFAEMATQPKYPGAPERKEVGPRVAQVGLVCIAGGLLLSIKPKKVPMTLSMTSQGFTMSWRL